MKRILGAFLLTAATAALLACSDDGGTKPAPGSSSGESSASGSEEGLSSDAEERASGTCGEETVRIAPDAGRIVYEGTWFPEIGPDSAILKRHSDECMLTSDCFTWYQIANIGYHQMMAGVTMRFKARADTVYMKWNELWQLDEGQRSLPYGVMRFGFYRDGEFAGMIGPEERDTSLRVLEPHGDVFWLVSTQYDSVVHCVPIAVNSPDREVEVEISMPHKLGLAFHGLEVPASAAISEPEARDQPVFAVVGNSIAHGEGQNRSEDGFAWKIARAKGWSLRNLAIGTTTISIGMVAKNLKAPNRADVVLIEWGYNDWSSVVLSFAAQTRRFNKMLDTLRALQPDAKIYVLTPPPNTTTSLSWSNNIVPAACTASKVANCYADSVTTDSAAVAAAPDSMVVGFSTATSLVEDLGEKVTDTTTIADWRRMMRDAVKRMKDAGDDKVFAIEGPDVATFADLSTDGVHLDSAGADAVAKRLIERLSL